MKLFGIDLEPGDWPAEPPKGAPTDIPGAFHVVEVASSQALDSMGRMLGVSADDEWNPHHICECVSVAAKIVLMPTVQAAGGPERYAALKRHAGAHCHGYTHPSGEPRKWLDPQGKPID